MKDPRPGIIAALTDRELLDKLLADDELTEYERSAFADWRAKINTGEWRGLMHTPRAWAEEVALRLMPIPADAVPRGREVATPDVQALAANLRAIQRERMQLDNERMQRWNLRWQKWIACGTVTSALVSFTSLLLAIWALGCSCGARH